MTIPILRPEAITPAWLTSVLHAGGVAAIVRDVTMTRVGTGQIGQSIKFILDYADAPPGAPASLVGKFPSPETESRDTGVSLGHYIREVNFYKYLAPTALIATPKCFFTDVDLSSGEFVLMMEDLAPAEQGDQLKGCTLEQARVAVYEAAKLHASYWNNVAIEELEWVSQTRAAGARGSADPAALSNLWHAFCVRYGAKLDAETRMIGEGLTANFA